MSERATSISGFASARALLWIAIAGSLWLAIPAQGDVVILHDGRMYAGVVERTTSQSVELFDGNLRRIVSRSALKEIVHERLDTSWVIVGDQMARQSQWDAAAAAYRQALRATDQHDVVLRRLEQLRSVRFRLPGSEKAESLLDAGHYAEATTALSGLIRDAHEPGQRHYWTLRLAQAYVGLARRQTSDGAVQPDAYLVYALAIAPDSGSAHALLGERLEAVGFRDLSRREFLLALDLDPLEAHARQRLAARGEKWTYDANVRDRSGIRDSVEGRSALPVEGDAPLTTTALTQEIGKWTARGETQAGHVLLAAYLVDPNAALAYQGSLPYPDYAEQMRAILKDTANTTETTTHDKTVIRNALDVRMSPRLVRSIAKVRSGYRADYVSPEGAVGFIPLTAWQWKRAARLSAVSLPFSEGARNLEKNILVACRYLDWLRGRVLEPYVGEALDRL